MSPNVPPILNNLKDYVQGMIEEHGVPALSIAVWYNNQLYNAASGVLNLNTCVEATTDAVFQIGSISKVITASLIMQLVDEGRLKLENPVKQYLPGFQIADKGVTEKITVGHLLDHTSGIPGDFLGSLSYTDDNAITRYVDRCYALHPLHPLGHKFSYSNAAYNIAGRLIEVVLGTTWFDAIEDRIFKPLGLQHAVAHPSQVLKYRAAMGHTNDESGQLTLSPRCYLPMGWAPCGATISMSATDLIAFAKAHLNKGKTESGEQWLSPESVQLMQTRRIRLPKNLSSMFNEWGIGWGLNSRTENLIVGHDGLTAGQSALLRLIPEQQIAFAAFHNSDLSPPSPAIANRLLNDLAGIELKPAPVSGMSLSQADMQALVGRYRINNVIADIAQEHQQLTFTLTWADNFLPPEKYVLKAIDKHSLASFTETGQRGPNVVFQDPDCNSRPAYLSTKLRLFERIQ